MIDFEAKADEMYTEWTVGALSKSDEYLIPLIAAFGRECAAQALKDAANETWNWCRCQKEGDECSAEKIKADLLYKAHALLQPISVTQSEEK